jgi:hypothetical protein
MSSGCCIDRHDCWITWEEEGAVLNFSDNLLDSLGWKTGDTLVWENSDDGSIFLYKDADE